MRGAAIWCGLLLSSVVHAQTVDSITYPVSISWTPPTANEDGSPLTDLAGYKIYAGHAPFTLRVVAWTWNPGLSRFVFDAPSRGIYYIAVSSLNSQGMESRLSDLALTFVN